MATPGSHHDSQGAAVFIIKRYFTFKVLFLCYLVSLIIVEKSVLNLTLIHLKIICISLNLLLRFSLVLFYVVLKCFGDL